MPNPARRMRMRKFHPKTSVVVLASILLIVLLASAIALPLLNSTLRNKAREQASAFGQRIGRPITIGDISVSILSGIAIDVSRVEIGAAPQEQLPVLTLQRAKVKPALLKILLSGGKQLEITSAEIEGLTLNLVRFSDGTTNLERIQSRLAEDGRTAVQSGQKEQTTQEPTASPNIQVDHFALREGRILLVDQAQAKARASDTNAPLQIGHLEILVDNVRAGKPLAVSVKAAVLGEQRNFELLLTSLPLPESLLPTLKQLALKVQPIDLKPIAPYLPRSLGLQEGRLSADLSADLGAAISGGQGETRVRGVLNALGLRFSGAEGGKSIDISLDAAVQGDAVKGDVQIDRLKLEVGPAEITGKGRVLGFMSKQPRVEGLEVMSRDLDLARIAALIPSLQQKLKGQIAGPIGLEVRGSGTESTALVEVKLDLTPVRLAIPDTLAKAPGKTATLVAHLRGIPGGALQFDLEADLAGADLRPGEVLNKPPGQPLDLRLSAIKRSGGAKDSLNIELNELKAHLRDSVLTGKGSVQRSGSGPEKKTNFELSLQSPRLDLDQLLLPSKDQEKPPLDPSLFAGIRGHAIAKIDSLRQSKTDFSNVTADVKMVDDELTLQLFSMEAFGGKVSANGSTFRLAGKAPFHLNAQLHNLDATRAMEFTTDHRLLAGILTSQVNVSGLRADKGGVQRSLSGALDGHLLEGKFLGRDLIASVWEPLAKALPLGLASLKKDEGATDLGKDLSFGITFEKGVAKLKAPLQITTPLAQMNFGGGIRLDGNLDLAGKILLQPSTVSSLTQGKLTPSDPIPVGLKLRGPAWKPMPTDLDLKEALAVITKQSAGAALGRFFRSRGGADGAVVPKGPQRPADAVGEQADKAQKEAQDKAKKFLKGFGN